MFTSQLVIARRGVTALGYVRESHISDAEPREREREKGDLKLATHVETPAELQYGISPPHDQPTN